MYTFLLKLVFYHCFKASLRHMRNLCWPESVWPIFDWLCEWHLSINIQNLLPGGLLTLRTFTRLPQIWKQHALFWAGLLFRGWAHFWVKVLFLPEKGWGAFRFFGGAMIPYPVEADSAGLLGWGSATFFFKGPDSKYFRLWGPNVSVASPQFCCYSPQATTDNMKTNGHSCVPIKFYL